MQTRRSQELFQHAVRQIPGGVNSPVRAWSAVGGNPLFIARGRGSFVFDADGNRYIDYVGSWGPLILGHAPPEIVRVVGRRAAAGSTFGAPTEAEVDLAELVVRCIPSVEKVRLVSSGTEATMTAIRLARAYTARAKIVKFDGCYHGHSDGLLVKAGSGVATLGLPDSPGVPGSVAKETLVATYNDIISVQAIFERYGRDIGAVIVEPICGNMGVIPPAGGFLNDLRRLTQRHRALLIFDEVITGFRVALGGAQELYEVKPDLTCLGKILGGGFPLAAVGGRREVMDLLAPAGPVYQAGTLSGNPVAVAAGVKTLQLLCRPRTYAQLEEKGKKLQAGFDSVLRKHRIQGVVNRVGSMLTLFFGTDRVTNAAEARQCDREKFASFFHGMLARGVYLPPAPFEAMFVSLAHSDAELNKTISAFADWAERGASV